MTPVHPLDPVCMSPEARMAEVAGLLAQGLVRLRTTPPVAQQKPSPRKPQKELGLCPPQRVHSTPDTRVRKAVRKALLAQQQGV